MRPGRRCLPLLPIVHNFRELLHGLHDSWAGTRKHGLIHIKDLIFGQTIQGTKQGALTHRDRGRIHGAVLHQVDVRIKAKHFFLAQAGQLDRIFHAVHASSPMNDFRNHGLLPGGQQIRVADLEKDAGAGLRPSCGQGVQFLAHGGHALARRARGVRQFAQAFHDGKKLFEIFQIKDGCGQAAFFQKAHGFQGFGSSAELNDQVGIQGQDQFRVGAQVCADGGFFQNGRRRVVGAGAGDDDLFATQIGQDFIEGSVKGDDASGRRAQADFPASVISDAQGLGRRWQTE